MKPHPTPERYVVFHPHYWNGVREEAWASYNVRLANMNNMPSAWSQAVHTAARHGGEIFAGYANGDLYSVESYRREVR